MMKVTAIVLAGGSGKRMGLAEKKQYLDLNGIPVLAYSLMRLQEQPFITDIVLVTAPEEEEYCRKQIIEKYGITKLRRFAAPGAERFDSVRNGLEACEEPDYVFIHDGARPFISDELLRRVFEDVKSYRACIAAVPVKDTIKITMDGASVSSTPQRSSLWQAQTPQAFEYRLISRAYRDVRAEDRAMLTDDASCVERSCDCPVHLTMGSYDNLKITTIEDLPVAKLLAPRYCSKEF